VDAQTRAMLLLLLLLLVPALVTTLPLPLRHASEGGTTTHHHAVRTRTMLAPPPPPPRLHPDVVGVRGLHLSNSSRERDLSVSVQPAPRLIGVPLPFASSCCSSIRWV
jgi:hypothetical protein